MTPYKLDRCRKFVSFVESSTVAGVDADARDSGHRPTPPQALLSIGHISSPSRRLKVWSEGRRADIPTCRSRIESDRPKFTPPETAKRGQVSQFSDKSRRRLVRLLSTMKASEAAYTMALTMVFSDGDDVVSLGEVIMKSFRKLARRLANVSRFACVSGFWKREYHKSGVVHYHLILFGIEDAGLRDEFQAWVVGQWNGLLGSHLTDEKREQHRWWHSRCQNMEEVKNFGYFAKYVGVPEESGALRGRWWGIFNKERLPVSSTSEIHLPEKAVAMLARLARKRQAVRANDAKHRKLSKSCSMVDGKGNPVLSRFQVSVGISNARHVPDEDFRDKPAHTRLGRTVKEIADFSGVRWGKADTSSRSSGSPIILCDALAPQFARKALQFVSDSLNQCLQLHETPNQSRETFTPCPLRPVPPGRTPTNRERIRVQADFLGGLETTGGGRRPFDEDAVRVPRSNRRIGGAVASKAGPSWL